MAVEFICDECGNRADSRFNYHGTPLMPSSWFEKNDEESVSHFCSQNCFEKLTKNLIPTSLDIAYEL